jgi:galactokinase
MNSTSLAPAAEFNPADMPAHFVAIYGGTPESVQVFSSPARINIIGEHIDYNGGKVFPAAIDKYLYIGIRKRTDSRIIYRDLRFPGVYEFDCTDTFTYKKEYTYANYLNGILTVFKRSGWQLDTGFEILMCSNIPPAGGISSSSALECGFAYAVSQVFGFPVSRVEIAKAGQQSEHEFMHVNCGIMDQFIIATAKKETAELLDCATLEYEYVPLQLGDYRFVVMNTNKKRALADSKYNERRSECEQGLAMLRAAGYTITTLCELTTKQFADAASCISDEKIRRRVRHCVTENERVQAAVTALKQNDLKELGRLLEASDASLRDDYEVTGIELDTITALARVQPGCIGARMTGAGFGGCAIALVKKEAAAAFIQAVGRGYAEKIGYEALFFTCESGDGVARYTK